MNKYLNSKNWIESTRKNQAMTLPTILFITFSILKDFCEMEKFQIKIYILKDIFFQLFFICMYHEVLNIDILIIDTAVGHYHVIIVTGVVFSLRF